MKTLIDTPVWSFLLRRNPGALSVPQYVVVQRWLRLAQDGDVVLIGAVRQEVLSGLRSPSTFDALRDSLGDFADEPAATVDYERAAQMSNICRAAGVQGSPTDFLICAVAERLDASILTTDRDFERFARQLAVRIEFT